MYIHRLVLIHLVHYDPDSTPPPTYNPPPKNQIRFYYHCSKYYRNGIYCKAPLRTIQWGYLIFVLIFVDVSKDVFQPKTGCSLSFSGM